MLASILTVLLGAAASPTAAPAPPPPREPAPATAPWRTLDTGLDLGEFVPPHTTGPDRLIHVLRIDPGRWRLRLLNASAEEGGRPRTARS